MKKDNPLKTIFKVEEPQNIPITSNKKKNNLIVTLVVIVLVSFSVLAYGLTNVYNDLKKKDSKIAAMIIAMKSFQASEDPDQAQLVTSLKNSLESAVANNNDLNNRIKELSGEIDKLKKDIKNGIAQVNSFKIQKAQLENTYKETSEEYDQKLAQADTDKTSMSEEIEKNKKEYEELKTSLNSQIEILSSQVSDFEKQKAVIEKSLVKFQKSRLTRETAKMHYNLANHFVEAKKYHLAIKEYVRALKLIPYDAEAHYNLALLYDIYRQDYPRALKHYKRCLEARPRFRKRQEVENRIVSLQLQESVSIDPTYAREVDPHKYEPESIAIPPPTESYIP